MIAWSRRTLTACTIATLTIALATMGGYRLAGSSSSRQEHARPAGSYALTYVSGTGSDNNAAAGCQRAAPCQSLGLAYSDTYTGGEIDAIDAEYSNALNIYQPITVDGGPARAVILASNDGVYINAGPSDVVILRHLQIHAYGPPTYYGINFVTGKALILDDVTIEGFNRGISVEAPGASVTISNSRIQHNTGAGIAITPSAGTVRVSINHSVISNNYYGLVADSGSEVSLTDSTVTSSTNIGVGCVTYGNGPCTIQTENDRLEHSYQAIFMMHGAGNSQITESLSNDAVFGNTYGIYGDFGGTLNAVTFGNNRFLNNFVNGSASSTVTQM